ncbi:MAG: TetR family transcriptional regulator [Phenylobacterium sp.]|uniref:TetR/AcrR family transcriptional regulator n=1 Tax=Phenylobacterium sp. TaxID=1871053 RepID=UPI001A51FCDD|nr:TetR/AcrR family transcriptional regulator [Phenylobacterium sp.]MBL8770373.1 TetR family transcriptional regulator [Phenylobacterium sp.]
MSATATRARARPRGDKRARTRARLIEATLALAAERGLAGATLDAIAARAGMTKGAIYSNFASRADLLVAARASKAITLIGPADDEPATLATLADRLVEVIERARPEGRFLGEYLAHALADPELGARVAGDYERQFREAGEAMARAYGEEFGVPTAEIPVIVQSLALGFLYQSLLTPRAVTRETVLAAFEALGRGIRPVSRR